ncbi:MAG: hypothetical protein KDK48_02735, partial [Chlamydiia bacterium]|nr:hypothetical protein [Chlamydiia bacterium]
MPAIWESRFEQVLQKTDIDDAHLIAQGREACGLGSKIKHVLGSLLFFSKPDLEALYRQKGQDVLRERNVKFIRGYADTTRPQLTEQVVKLLTTIAPDKHLITREEIALGEALYALESLRSENIKRSWITPEQIKSLQASEQTIGTIRNLKELDDLCLAGRGQTHRFSHCVSEVMGERDILKVTDRDVLEIRALFQAWVSVSPPPDALNFKTLVGLYKGLTGRKTLNAGDCRRVHDILRIAQNQTMRVNTAKFVPEEYVQLLDQYGKERSLERWGRDDFARIEKLTNLWTNYLPNDSLGELMNFLTIAYSMHDKEIDDEKLLGLTPEVLASLEKILEVKQLIRMEPDEMFKAERVYKGIVKLTGKELTEITEADLDAVKGALKVHADHPEVSFKEFYKLYERVSAPNLPYALAAYPGYKQQMSELPDRKPNVDEFLALSSRIAKKEKMEEADWAIVKSHFQRVENYPLPEGIANSYHRLLGKFLTEGTTDAFVLATGVLPGHPNVALALFKPCREATCAEEMDPLDLRETLYRLKLLYDETLPEEHPMLDRALEKTFQERFPNVMEALLPITYYHIPEGSEDIDGWIQAARAEFQEGRGVERVIPQVAVTLDAKDKLHIRTVSEEALKRGVLEAAEVDTLIRDCVALEGKVNPTTLRELLLSRENRKLLDREYPPLFQGLMMRHLFLADEKVIRGQKPLADNHLYKLPLSAQGIACARMMVADLNRQNPESKLSTAVVEEVMLKPPPKSAEEVEKRLRGLVDLQILYGNILKTNEGVKELRPLIHEFLQKMGPVLIDEEFRGSKTDLASVTDVMNGVLARLQSIQEETDLSPETLCEAALKAQLPEKKSFWGMVYEYFAGSDEPTLINRLDALREALDKPEGRQQFNKILFEMYTRRACETALTQEYQKPSDDAAVALYAEQLGALFENQGVLVNQSVRSYVYNLAKVATHFINEGHSPREVFYAIGNSGMIEKDLEAVSKMQAVDENGFVRLTAHLQQHFIKMPPGNPWYKLRDRIHQKPELLFSKILPALLDAMAETKEERAKARQARGQLEEVAALLDGMALKKKMQEAASPKSDIKAGFRPVNPDSSPVGDLLMNLMLTLISTDPQFTEEQFQVLSPRIAGALKDQADRAV